MKIKEVINKFFLNKEEKKFINLYKLKNKIDSKKTIIFELKNDHFALVHIKHLLDDKKFIGKNFVGLWTGCLQREKGMVNFIKFFFKLIIYFFEKKKWFKIYNSIGIDKIYSINDDIKTNFFPYQSLFEKKVLKVKDKKKFIKLKYKNILIGELMYDFYLRYFKKYNLNFNDHYEIQKTSNYVECFYKNLSHLLSDIKKKNIDRFVPWQACYIQCGLPIRFFIKNNINTIGKAQEIFSKIYSKKDYYPTYRFESLKKSFQKVKNKKQKIKEAYKFLEDRYNGLINPEINYLSHSPFNKNYTNLEQKIEVIIFLPDFVDSPHSFGGNFVFPDYYDWITKTIDFFENIKVINVAIKPHPNSRYASRIFEEILENKYKQFYWIKRSISNHAIFKKKPIIGISPRGSVLFDLAYHGITPIAFGRNPCMAYPFVYTAKTEKQYFDLIKKGLMHKLKLPINYKNLIAECYYMNFINKTEYYETTSSKIKLKNYRAASVKDNTHMLRMYNNNYFSKLLNNSFKL